MGGGKTCPSRVMLTGMLISLAASVLVGAAEEVFEATLLWLVTWDPCRSNTVAFVGPVRAKMHDGSMADSSSIRS